MGLWLAQVGAALSASSIYSEFEEHEWIHEVNTKTFLELADAGERLRKLDQMLGVALVEVLNEELKWEYQQRVEEMAKLGRPVGGRQIAWIIVQATKSTEADAFITSYENIKEMPWYGDAMYQIVQMYYEWVRLRRNLAKDITDETARNVLFEKMNTHSKVFVEDCAH